MKPPPIGYDEDGPIPADPRHITGQVFVRETGAVTMDGRRLVILAGVVALDRRALEGEHQYVVLGRVDADTDIVRLSVIPHQSVHDRTELARGMGIDDLLTTPIWRT
jgi:hypothetical protein